MKLSYEVRDGSLYIGDTPFSIPDVRVREVIGKGANGVVLSAVDNLSRDVAVKVYISDRERREGDRRNKVRQAVQEASKIASLEHERIARIYHAREICGRLVVVMQRINGVTLKVYLSSLKDFSFAPGPSAERQQWEENHRANLLRQLLEGLEFSYKNGVAHGDLHDRNIMVECAESREGWPGTPVVKVIDFGASVLLDGYSEKDLQSKDSRDIRKLRNNILPALRAYDKILANTVEEGSPLRAVQTTQALVAIHEILRRMRKRVAAIGPAEPDDLELRSSAYALANSVADGPAFDVEALAAILTGIHPALCQDALDAIVAREKLESAPEGTSSRSRAGASLADAKSSIEILRKRWLMDPATDTR